MDYGALEAKLHELLSSCVPDRQAPTAILPEMNLRRDLGLDSVGLVLLLLKFEQEFGVEMPNSALARGRMTSVGELIQAVMEVLQERSEAGRTPDAAP